MRRIGLNVIFVIAGVIIALTACGGDVSPAPNLISTDPTKAPEATATTASEPAPAEAEDDVWARIQSEGKIVVGTSSGYPPFEFINEETLDLDGFDIALIKAISSRLGVEVKIEDFVFDSLVPALQLKQIDIAIAAMSITPERDALVDFTDVYYKGTDAVLAHEESAITIIKNIEDVAGHRVGIQNGTVYETILQDKIATDSLLIYPKIEQAISDLRAGHIDLVVMDYLPAQAYVTQGGIKIVGQDLQKQEFALVIPEGATSLKSELDRVLAELEAEGFIDQLTEEYLTGSN